MYNFYSSKDGCMDDDKRERGCGDMEYNTFDNGCYNKEDGGNNKGNERKEEKSCVIINIYCDSCKKEPKKDDCKNNCRDNCRDDCKKDNICKEDKSCVIINIFCDKGNK